MADGRVLIDTKLDTSKLNGQVSKLKGNLSAGLASVAKVGAAALGAATAAVTAFTVSAIKDFVSFEDKMNEVFTLIPGASQEMKDSMVSDVKDIAKEMGVLPEDVIPAVYQALSAGVPTDNVFSFVETATKLAKAGVAELDDSVGVLSTVVNNYASMGLTAEEASNMLFTTVKNGVTTIPELSTKLGDVVPIASALGINFGEVSASMATMTSTMGAGSTTKAVTNLRGMLNELGKEGSQADKAFQDIAGVGFAKFIEGGGTMEEAMEVLRQASVKNDTAINNLFGSIEAGQAALILAGDGADKFSMNLDAMADSAGATDEAFETMAGGAQFAIDRINANIEVLKLNFVNEFAPAFDELLGSVLGLMDGTAGASEQFGNAITSILNNIMTNVMEALPSIISIGTNIVISLAKGILTGLPKMIAELAYMTGFAIGYLVERLPEFLQQGLAFVGNIAMGIVQGIPNVLDKVGGLIEDTLNWLSEHMPSLLESGKEIVTNLVIGIVEKAPEAIAKAGEIISNIAAWFMQNAPQLIGSGLELILNLLKGIVDNVPQIIGAIKNMLGSLITTIVENGPEFLAKGKEIMTNFWDGLKEIFGPVIASIGGLLLDIIKAIGDKATDIYNKAKDVFNNIVTAIADKSVDIYNKSKEVFNNIVIAIGDKATDIYNKSKEVIGGIVTAIADKSVEIFNKAKQAVGLIVTAIASKAKDIYNKAKDGVGGIVTAITDKAVDIFNSAKDIGKNLIDGFVQGFEALKDAAKKKITGFFDGVVDSVKGLLGIESPSKVFKDIGENTAQGFEDGLEDGKAGVMRTADSLGYETIEAVEAYQPQAVQAGADIGTGVAQGIEDETQTAVDAGVGMGEDITNGVNTGIANVKGSVQQQWNDILDGMTENAQVAAGIMKSALESTLSSFTELGTALYDGGVGWQNFAKIALGALSDILMSLGHELAARAALAAVSFNWTGAALATAGAAAAYTAAGLIDGWASSYDVGGIIQSDQLANIHKGETILPAGISADMRSAGLEIRPLGGGARDIVVNGVLEVDGRRLAKAVFRYTDDNVGLSYV